MANYNDLITAIDSVIKTNNRREITGLLLQNVLNTMVGSLGENYQLAGFATPTTNPHQPDQNVFYIASDAGVYTQFDNIVLDDGLSFLMWKNGAWTSHTVPAVSQTWVQNNFVSKEWFRKVFRVYDANDLEIVPNDMESVADNIKAMVGLWTNQYLSALGMGQDGGGAVQTLAGLSDVAITTPSANQMLSYDVTTQKWVNVAIPATGVTSVATGTGLTGGTITGTGTISINSTYQTYISHGESAYNSLSNYLPLAGGTMTGAINLATDKYWEQGVCGMRCYNSDIAEVGKIWFNDESENAGDSSLIFPRANGKYDIFRAANGTFYFHNNKNVSDFATTTSAICAVETESGGGAFKIYGQTYTIGLHVGTGQINRGIYDWTNGIDNWLIAFDNNNTLLTYGNVGIGVGNPVTKLHVNGSITAGAGNTTFVQIGAIKLQYDSANNAIKVVKADGSAANLYATGGLSALGAGQESGGSIATSAYRLANTYTENTRPSSANVSYGDGCVRYFLATSSMSAGKPTMEDSSILHLAWDNTGGWDKQIAFGHGNHGYLQYRSQNEGVWSDWNTIVQMVGDSSLCIYHTGSDYGEGIRLANKNGETYTWSEINFGCDASTTVGTHAHQWTVGRNGNNDYFVIRNYDYNRFFIDLNGNVYIGDGNPSYKLHVSGTVGATGFTNTSDIRKKNVIKDTDLRIEQIAKAPAFEYYWLDQSIDHDLHVGTSAQYWESVLPQVVTTAKDEIGTKSLQYGVAALVSTITVARKVMTHEEKIALLETRVSALEKENGEQEQLINSLQEELAKFKAA